MLVSVVDLFLFLLPPDFILRSSCGIAQGNFLNLSRHLFTYVLLLYSYIAYCRSHVTVFTAKGKFLQSFCSTICVNKFSA